MYFSSVASHASGAFDCSADDTGSSTSCVHLGGELDVATTPLLEATLRASHPRLVVLDLRDLGFVDSSGVHTILEADVRAREEGGRLVIVRGPPPVDRVFSLTGTREQLEFVDLDPAEPPLMALLRLARAE